MENLLNYGLTNDIFEPKHVMNLFYGSLSYFSQKTAPFHEKQGFCKWDAYPCSANTWHDIPLSQRMEIIALTIKKAQASRLNGLSCFHDRMLCLMHELLNDEENKVECFYEHYNGKGIDTITYSKYNAFVDPNLLQALVTEMFLWWHMGVRKSNEERRLLKQCWIKFLGFERKYPPKIMLTLTAQRIEELEFLLAQIDKKDDAAHHRFWQAQSNQNKCQTALDFLRGFQDYISATAELKQKEIT